MGNISNNLVNGIIGQPALGVAHTAIQTVGSSIAGVAHTLTDEERASYHSLDVNNKVFVEEALQEATNHSMMLPSAINVMFLSNDLTLFNETDELESLLEEQLRVVRDTKRVAGHEAYVMALTIYTLFRALAAAGVQGAQQSADRLGERFANNGGGAPRAADESSAPTS